MLKKVDCRRNQIDQNTNATGEKLSSPANRKDVDRDSWRFDSSQFA